MYSLYVIVVYYNLLSIIINSNDTQYDFKINSTHFVIDIIIIQVVSFNKYYTIRM